MTRQDEQAVSSPLLIHVCCRAPSSGHMLGMELVLTPVCKAVEESPEGGQGSAGGTGTPGAVVLMSPGLSHVPPPDV